MSDIKVGHRSFSQYKSYANCGEAYRLERIIQVPQHPAWWFIGGSAFHTATEWLDTGKETDPDVAWAAAWNEHFNEQLANTEVPQKEWRAGGRRSKANPDKENGPFWMEYGKTLTRDYAQWRTANYGWGLYELPDPADDGEGMSIPYIPAVEWGGTVWFGTTPVKAFIDRIFVTPTGELCVVDLKTGSRDPDPQQLALYASVVELATGFRPNLGAYYMARKGTITVPVPLDEWGIDYWTSIFDTLERAIGAGVFLPNVSSMCNTCGVRDYCKAVGGPLSAWSAPRLNGGK